MGVVGPDGIKNVAVEVQAEVIAKFVAVAQAHAAGGPGADFDLREERQPAVHADRSPELHTVIRRAVAAIVPNHAEIAGIGVERDFREELALGARVGIDAKGAAPGAGVIVGKAHEDVEVIGNRGGGVGVTQVQPAAVRARGVVVGQAEFRVHGTAGLCGDGSQAADGGRHGSSGHAETAGGAHGGIDGDIDGGRADAGIGGLVSDGHSTIWANRDVAEIPGVGPGDREGGSECADGARTRHSSSAGDDAGAGAVYNPDRLLSWACSRAGFDGGLVKARAADGEYRSGESLTGIVAFAHEYLAESRVERGCEEVSEAVESAGGVASKSGPTVGPGKSRGPVRAAVDGEIG